MAIKSEVVNKMLNKVENQIELLEKRSTEKCLHISESIELSRTIKDLAEFRIKHYLDNEIKQEDFVN